MNRYFNIANGYSYTLSEIDQSGIMARGRAASRQFAEDVRQAMERAICRFYKVPSLTDCNADKILLAGLHDYENGIPFKVMQFPGNSVAVIDNSTKREIIFIGRLDVERNEQDISCLEDSIKRVAVFINIQQSYRTLDGIK